MEDNGFTNTEIKFMEIATILFPKYENITLASLYNDTFDTDLTEREFMDRFMDYKWTILKEPKPSTSKRIHPNVNVEKFINDKSHAGLSKNPIELLNMYDAWMCNNIKCPDKEKTRDYDFDNILNNIHLMLRGIV